MAFTGFFFYWIFDGGQVVGSRWKGTPTTLVIDIIIETMETGGIHMWPVSTWEVLPSFCTEFFFQTEHSVWLLLCFFFFCFVLAASVSFFPVCLLLLFFFAALSGRHGYVKENGT